MLETSSAAHAVATTRGCARSHDASVASFRVWALETAGAGGAAGYGGQVHRDVGELRLAEETERAIRICAMSRDPASLDAGTYDVVMEPEAVTELLEWLSMIAFAAPEVEQPRVSKPRSAGVRPVSSSASVSSLHGACCRRSSPGTARSPGSRRCH